MGVVIFSLISIAIALLQRLYVNLRIAKVRIKPDKTNSTKKKRVEFTRLDTKNINMEGLVFYLSLSFGRHLIKIEAASITDTLPNIVPSTLKPL